MAVDSLITAICGMVGSSDAPNGSTLDCAAIGFRRDLNKVKRSNGGVIGFTFPRFFVVARRRPSSRARLTALFGRDESLSPGMPAVVGWVVQSTEHLVTHRPYLPRDLIPPGD